jgi:hypothetical protein
LGKLNGQKHSPSADLLVAWDGAGRANALAEAARLRAAGNRVVSSFIGADVDANIAFARGRGIKNICCFEGADKRTLRVEDEN